MISEKEKKEETQEALVERILSLSPEEKAGLYRSIAPAFSDFEDSVSMVDETVRFPAFFPEIAAAATYEIITSHFGIEAARGMFGKMARVEVITIGETTYKYFEGQTVLENGRGAIKFCPIKTALSDGQYSFNFEGMKYYWAKIQESIVAIHKRAEEIQEEYVSSSAFCFRNGRISPFTIVPTEGIFLNADNEFLVKNMLLPDLLTDSKRTYLFIGTYGTGKTETAMRVGEYAAMNKTTFIYVPNPEDFKEVLKKASDFQKVVIFVEDVDKLAEGQDRTEEINDMLNLLDGVETKNKNIKIIFTTNHQEEINAAMRRPGRIDMILNFEVCEKEVVEKIYRFNGIPEEFIELMVNVSPNAQGAIITEIAKRAKRMASVTGWNVESCNAAIKSMQWQLDYLHRASSIKKEGTLIQFARTIEESLVKGGVEFTNE
jgi:hypothetical protein